METGGGSGPSGAEDRRQSLTCSLCLSIYTQPKALPCLHTYCLKCLQDLTSRGNSPTFPCPLCRTDVMIPAGGVSAFPANFHIRLEDLNIAREGKLCLTHPKQDLDLYCVDCHVAVCLKCVVTEHPPPKHTTQNLSAAAAEARPQLTRDGDRLKDAVSCMVGKVETGQRQQQDLRDKKAAVKSVIRNKRATLLALAEKYEKDLLASLDTACGPLEAELTSAVSASTRSLDDLRHLEQQVQQTLDNGTDCALLALAKETREGKGSARVIGDMTSAQRNVITHPVLTSLHTLDTLTSHVRQFFGVVDTVQMEVGAAEVEVEVEKFACSTHPDTEVFSLCPKDNGEVMVSYVSRGLDNNAPIDKFKESGQHVRVDTELCGKRSWKGTGESKAMCCTPSDSGFGTHSKRRGHYTHHLRLWNKLQGKADIVKDKVTSEKPFKTEYVTEFSINVNMHRGFDVDSSEQFFAVVEEAEAPGQPRKVKLFQRNKADAVDTYTAPSKLFQPADVCFTTLRGKEVLLIADEGTDTVHVVHVQDGVMTFLRHLAPGHPLLVQPTALNTDHRGRLWVACRGGTILTVTPITF